VTGSCVEHLFVNVSRVEGRTPRGSQAFRTLIWDKPDFVAAVLHAADRHGEEIRRAMAGALWAATVTGSRMGTPGQPFREDVEQRDRSRALAQSLPSSSLEEQFYRDIARSAEDRIADEAAIDLPNDGREW
jgi:hypothetical protein